MSWGIDRAREELIKVKIILRRQERIVADSVAEAIRHDGLRRSEPEKPLPDVPLHKRGFGVLDEDAP
jgi:hypothetical protein